MISRNSAEHFLRVKRICPAIFLHSATDKGFVMRIGHAALLLAVSASPALAQRIPTIVIPGRPDIPIVMNGVDVSWSVIEGDFGLDRPIGMTPTVIYRPFAIVTPYYGPGAYRYGPQAFGPHYFPATGERPGYGRLEIVPPPDRPLPPPAPSFRQGWSSQSEPGPVTEYPPFAMPPAFIWGGGGHNWRWEHGANPQGLAPRSPGNER
jgi:hypothetical protein